MSRTTAEPAPKRTAPFDVEPGFYEPAGLWLYGNARLLERELDYVPSAFGPDDHFTDELDEVEKQAEELVLQGKVLVCGFHNTAHMRVAIVPLRWGSPRIVVMSGGFKYHLGDTLDDEPFRTARLWRFAWDPKTDLAVSRRAPEKLPTFARHNRTVDRLIMNIAEHVPIGLEVLTGKAVKQVIKSASEQLALQV